MNRFVMLASGGILGIVMLGLEIAQLIVLSLIFESLFGGYFFLALLCSFFLSSSFPLITIIFGIFGAIDVLEWNIFLSIALFAPMLIIHILALFGIGITAIFESIKKWIKNA